MSGKGCGIIVFAFFFLLVFFCNGLPLKSSHKFLPPISVWCKPLFIDKKSLLFSIF